MSIIDPAPQFDSNKYDTEGYYKLLKTGRVPELQNLLRKANDQYMYWSEIRHRIPTGVDVKAEEIWAYIKIGRTINQKVTVIKDGNNNLFTYWIPDSLYRAISEVDKWSGGVITTENPSGLPDKERYIINSLMEEAIASSQLEGASTENRVAKELLRTGRKPEDHDERMIFNNWKAMQYIRANVKNEITSERIREVHSILTQGTLKNPEESGKFRTTDDVAVYYRDEIVHTPPKADSLKERINNLCEFANTDSEDKWIHPIIKGTMLHFGLAYDHPFVDGNGRTARALMYWYILSRGYSLFQYLSISKHFLRAPGQYVKAYLYTEHDDNDLTYFLVYNLASVSFALKDLRKYLHEKQGEVVKANQLLNKVRGLNLRQKSLIYHSIQHADTVYTIEAHKNSHGIAYETARKDLMLLVKKGFLKEQKEGKRMLIFMPSGKVLEKLKIQ